MLKSEPESEAKAERPCEAREKGERPDSVIPMGGVPKWNTTKSKRNKRRMHLFLEKPTLTSCPKCGKPVLSHTVCLNCGYYKGNEVIDVLKKLTKKEQKLKARELKSKAEGETAGKEKPLNWEELSKK